MILLMVHGSRFTFTVSHHPRQEVAKVGLKRADVGSRSSRQHHEGPVLTEAKRHDLRRVSRPRHRLGIRPSSMYARGGMRVLSKWPHTNTIVASHVPRRLASSRRQQKNEEPRGGTTTPVPDEASVVVSKSAYYFEAGYGLFAKRPSRPFPPPFLSPPSGSFSDPLSTHDRSRDRRPSVNGDMIRGMTNGDDAVLVSDNFIGANDGVGAWAGRERGHAA